MPFPLAEAAEASNGNITLAAVLSALGGATVAGISSIWLAYINRSTQREQARAQSTRDLRKWRRELRRQSYSDCVISFEKLRDMIAPLAKVLPWPVPRALSAGERQELDNLISRLADCYDDAFQKCQIVRLEGPEPVATSANRMLRTGDCARNAPGTASFHDGPRAARRSAALGIPLPLPGQRSSVSRLSRRAGGRPGCPAPRTPRTWPACRPGHRRRTRCSRPCRRRAL